MDGLLTSGKYRKRMAPAGDCKTAAACHGVGVLAGAVNTAPSLVSTGVGVGGRGVEVALGVGVGRAVGGRGAGVALGVDVGGAGGGSAVAVSLCVDVGGAGGGSAVAVSLGVGDGRAVGSAVAVAVAVGAAHTAAKVMPGGGCALSTEPAPHTQPSRLPGSTVLLAAPVCA